MATEQQVGSEAVGARLSVFSVQTSTVSPGELGGRLPTDATWYEENDVLRRFKQANVNNMRQNQEMMVCEQTVYVEYSNSK